MIGVSRASRRLAAGLAAGVATLCFAVAMLGSAAAARADECPKDKVLTEHADIC